MDKIRWGKVPGWFSEACAVHTACPADRKPAEWLHLDHHATRQWFRRFARVNDALVIEHVRPGHVDEVRQFAAKIQATVSVPDTGGTAVFTQA